MKPFHPTFLLNRGGGERPQKTCKHKNTCIVKLIQWWMDAGRTDLNIYMDNSTILCASEIRQEEALHGKQIFN